jgi:hypothetical protein
MEGKEPHNWDRKDTQHYPVYIVVRWLQNRLNFRESFVYIFVPALLTRFSQTGMLTVGLWTFCLCLVLSVKTNLKHFYVVIRHKIFSPAKSTMRQLLI